MAAAEIAMMPMPIMIGFWLTCNHAEAFSIGSSDRRTEVDEVRVACAIRDVVLGETDGDGPAGPTSPSVGQPLNIVEVGAVSTPGRSRTGDQQFRKLLLYPTELRGQIARTPDRWVPARFTSS